MVSFFFIVVTWKMFAFYKKILYYSSIRRSGKELLCTSKKSH